MKPGHSQETVIPHEIRDLLASVTSKWSAAAIVELGRGSRRFNELRRCLAGVSQKVLTSTLRSLERDGLVARRVHPTNPPSVEYRLTPLGEDLATRLEALGLWALENSAKVLAARRAFEET